MVTDRGPSLAVAERPSPFVCISESFYNSCSSGKRGKLSKALKYTLFHT